LFQVVRGVKLPLPIVANGRLDLHSRHFSEESPLLYVSEEKPE
jgi:hypothetical protein